MESWKLWTAPEGQRPSPQTPLRAPNGGAFAVGAIALINTFETDLKKPVTSSALWEAPESQTLVQPHV